MSVNYGKKFENVIRECFEKVSNVSIDRLHDQTTGFWGSTNVSDYIVYRKPYEYYFECKSVHGNTLSIHSNDEKHKYGNITNKQWEGLLEKSKIQGVFAGVIVWFADKDITAFIPIQELVLAKQNGYKSIRFDYEPFFVKGFMKIQGKKKRVFYDYDMGGFLNELSTTSDT